MRVHVIAMGDRMPAWVEQGYQEYAKRLGSELQLYLHELTPEKRGKGADVKRILQKEGERMLQAIPANCDVVALDREGQSLSTESLADKLKDWLGAGRDLAWLIGGPEGMSPACLQRAQWRVSLSAMTFPHPLVRIILAEQIYRAYSILKNHPYHK
ncbi:MAG: 23S rRNA (pseudouridine(1915)-N(3))-methyltransferase RlmH [Gammaproteobacteria bacterium]|nr:23S rRNA (pseudouridine(1915)-N(3))-methyltransferase RlmH [Gammaproteobacteria bacterium]